MLITRSVIGILLAVLMCSSTAVVLGQDYPTKTVHIVATGGGSNDFTARIIAQGITGSLGQPVVVDNRPAAIIATETAAKAAPDGYTLLVSGGTLWLMPLLQKTPYDEKDFAPISLIARTPSTLAVHPSLPVKSVKELISLARARPGELNYSATGPGSASWLATELFKSLSGVNIVNVPYKVLAQGMTALISGEVHMAISDTGLVMPQAKVGKLRALAVTSATQSALAPGLPPMAASGLPGYDMVGVITILAPAKTPAAVINRLNREVVRLLASRDIGERFLGAGAEVVGSSPEQLTDKIKSDTVRVAKLIRDAGIKVE